MDKQEILDKIANSLNEISKCLKDINERQKIENFIKMKKVDLNNKNCILCKSCNEISTTYVKLQCCNTLSEVEKEINLYCKRCCGYYN